ARTVRMREWPLHAVFATMLVGSLAAKERATDVLIDLDDVDRETAVTRVARSYGLVLRGYVTLPGTLVPALAFEAPGCSRPVPVVLTASFNHQPHSRTGRCAALRLYRPHLGEARSSSVLCRANEIRSIRNVRPDAVRAVWALAAGRVAIELPGRRYDRLAECLESRLCRGHQSGH